MNTAIDLTGKKFGHLRVTREVERRNAKRMWECKCECGGIAKRDTYYLTHGGEDLSCGCVHHQRIAQSQIKHGMSKTRLYKIWEAMKRRCDNPKAERYPRYGGRGIRYCDAWKKFDLFWEWARQSGYAEGLSLDRIDVNGDYCPENCRWIPLKDQNNNMSTNRRIVFGGESLTVAQFARLIERPYSAVYQEIYKLGWTPERCAEHKGGGS